MSPGRGEIADFAGPDTIRTLAVGGSTTFGSERIFSVQKEMNFTVVDARRAFEGLDYTARQALFYDEMHPSAAGNQRLAEFICQQFPAPDATPRK